MNVSFQIEGCPKDQCEMFVVGDSFALQQGLDEPFMRIGPLTSEQWKMIARGAQERAGASKNK